MPTQEQLDRWASLTDEQREMWISSTDAQKTALTGGAYQAPVTAPTTTGLLSFGSFEPAPSSLPAAPAPEPAPSSLPAAPDPAPTDLGLGGLDTTQLSTLQHMVDAGLSREDIHELGGIINTQPYQMRQEGTDLFYSYEGVPDSERPAFDDAMQDFMNQWYGLEQNQPEMFQVLARRNPQAAALYYARQGDSGINYGYEGYQTREERQRARELASQYGYLATGSEETATDYSGDVFEDVTREWRYGDTFKIGTAQTPMNGFGDFIEHNPLNAVAMAGTLLAAPYLATTFGPVVAGALVSGTNTALTGGDVEDIIRAGITGAATSGVLNQYIPVANQENFVGALVRGGANDIIATAINEGDLASVDDILKAAVTQFAVEGVADVFGDADATKAGEINENTTINGKTIAQISKETGESVKDLIEKYTNTTDLMGIFGDNGFLDQLGLDVDYLPTDYIGDAFNFLQLGTPISDPGGEKAAAAKAELEGIASDTSLTYEQKQEQIRNVLDQYAIDVQPYDERYFDLFSPRSDDADLTGIWTESPNASTTGMFGFPTGGDPASSPATSTFNPITDDIKKPGDDTATADTTTTPATADTTTTPATADTTTVPTTADTTTTPTTADTTTVPTTTSPDTTVIPTSIDDFQSDLSFGGDRIVNINDDDTTAINIPDPFDPDINDYPIPPPPELIPPPPEEVPPPEEILEEELPDHSGIEGNTFAMLAAGDQTDLFEYTKLTPSARALLGPYIDHLAGIN